MLGAHEAASVVSSAGKVQNAALLPEGADLLGSFPSENLGDRCHGKEETHYAVSLLSRGDACNLIATA